VPTVAELYEACRLQAGGSLDDLAQPVPLPYTWDDIVLPTDRLERLREVAAHVAHRGTVYDDWGFAERYATGNGLVALFSGPSGTGKTMAASIVARQAGLDLYRIDLSSVVSKYIGETEKNLGRIFDEAGKGDAVLLFDEADALFGKRSEVKDAHDRYANVEVNYLLQRVETYDGVVILTTNFKRNIDEAFTRRIHLHVEFPLPDREARAAIWEGVFPEPTPVAGLDIDFLAGLELTGGNIRSAALRAAFIAAAEGTDVAMRHVVRATKRELQKAGTLVEPREFGEYWDLAT
jgi:SpoVK/Ycf46/Vps4 family AAA+-type ATPase